MAEARDPVRPVVYDFSRLPTRVLNPTPNGIDRIDMHLARHFLARDPAWPLMFGLRGPRLRPATDARAWLDRLEALWRETGAADVDAACDAVADALLSAAGPTQLSLGRRGAGRLGRMAEGARVLRRFRLADGPSPRDVAPPNAVFLNATHFPIESPRHVAWLDERPDIRPVLFVHDVLPVSHPHLFWGREPARHKQRLEFLARRGAGALVTTKRVEAALNEILATLGRANLPVFCAAPPVAPIFLAPAVPVARLRGRAYFVVCGTIEPRKNHVFLAALWRRLVESFGPRAPKLLVVGKRGWSYKPIVRALHDPALRGHVVEVSGVPTAAYRRLLEGARALLAPSLDEGFGLTVAEALAAGVPAIASDIPAHREQHGALFLSTDRPDDWIEAIASATRSDFDGRRPPAAPPSDYFSRVDAFLAGL